MKNLHVLPTQNEITSKLFKVSNELKLTRKYDFYNGAKYQHIYITCDEEIKQGDYGLSKLNEIINFHNGYDYRYYKKIILTTDQDLIADGVQAIDDEFLEWFVNNPSCEGVEVADLWKDGNPSTHFSYQIIIPQEEPKQELNLNCFDCNKSLQDCTCMEDTINMKQETFEEASAKLNKHYETAKWQQEPKQERMYSEEEVIKIVEKNRETGLTAEFLLLTEQFKKK
jgi:hypothetical protein